MGDNDKKAIAYENASKITIMVKKYKSDSSQPTHWKLGLDCNHAPIMTNEQIKGAMVDSRYGVKGSDITIVCPLCKEHAPGSCEYTPLHKVILMTPLYTRQYNLQMEEQQQQPQEQEEQQVY